MDRVIKCISFFWGGSKLSWLRHMTLHSFRELHPDWEIKLYISDLDIQVNKTWESIHEQDFFIYEGEDFMNIVSKLGIEVIPWSMEGNLPPSQKSNFFKWSILASSGGVYSDMDIIFIKSIGGLYNKFVKMRGDVALTHNGYFSIGFMMSASNNNVFKEIYNNTVKEFKPKEYQGAGVNAIYKRWKDYDQMVKEFPQCVFYNIPWRSFYALRFDEQDEMFRQDHFETVQLYSLGVHWFAGSKAAQHYNNWVNTSNFKSVKNTISSALCNVLKVKR